MTPPDRDYDEVLSRVLHSALDPVEPAGDGLAKIQRRIAEPWLKRQLSLLRTEFAALGWLIVVRCEPFLSRARSGLAAFAAKFFGWLRPAPPAAGQHGAAPGGHGTSGQRASAGPGTAGLQRWLGPTMAWLRPTLAVCGAVVIVVAGVFALGQFRQNIFPTDNPSANTPGHVHGRGAKPGAAGGINSLRPTSSHHSTGKSRARPRTSGSAGKGSAKPAPTCSATATATPSPSVSTSPSPSPTPTTPSPSPTTTSPTPPPTSPPAGSPAGSPAGGANAAAALSRGRLPSGSCVT